jgi:hypothetical protein
MHNKAIEAGGQAQPKLESISERYIIVAPPSSGIDIAPRATSACRVPGRAEKRTRLGTRQLVAELLDVHRERINEVFGHVLAAIEDVRWKREDLCGEG